MNEPNEFEITVPEGVLPEEPVPEVPAPEVPGSANYTLPEGYVTAEAPPPEPPVEEPPIERHDPFAYMRGAPWMNRKLSPSGRAAAFLRRELEAFPVIEGRDPNHADLDGIVKRTVDYMVPIFKRERATDIAYDELEKRRKARMAGARPAFGHVIASNDVKVSGEVAPTESGPELEIVRRHLNEQLSRHPQDTAPPPNSLDYETASRRLEELRNRRGIAPNVEPPPGTAQYEQSRLEGQKLSPDWDGRRVFLSNGLAIPDRYSPTGKVMAPVDDLAAVAEAGREAGNTFRTLAISSLTLSVAAEYLRRALRDNVGHAAGSTINAGVTMRIRIASSS